MTDKRVAEIEIRFDPFTDTNFEISDDDDDLVARSETDDDLDLIEHVRERLGLDHTISDVTIAASLAQIGSRGDTRGRWLAAFGSPLGKHLAVRGSDLNTLLNALLGLAPRHQS